MSATAPLQNLVIVGRKPTFRYVTACITLFNRGEREITLRARGRSIFNCVETVELLRRSFWPDLRVKEIRIWSEEYEAGGRRRFISYMQIIIQRS